MGFNVCRNRPFLMQPEESDSLKEYKQEIDRAVLAVTNDDNTLKYLAAADKLKEIETKILEKIIQNFRETKYREVYKEQKVLANLRVYVVYKYAKDMPEEDKKTLTKQLSKSKNWRKHVAVFADENEKTLLNNVFTSLEEELSKLDMAKQAALGLNDQRYETEKTRKELSAINPQVKRKAGVMKEADDSSVTSAAAAAAGGVPDVVSDEDMVFASRDEDLSSSIALVQLNSDDEEDLGEWIPSSGADKEE